MALTVEELQIVLSCDATTAQKVLDKMDATVKAYTERFQKYFQTKSGDVKPLDGVAKQIDKGVKDIKAKTKEVQKAMDFTPKYKGTGLTYADVGRTAAEKAAQGRAAAEAYNREFAKARPNGSANPKLLGLGASTGADLKTIYAHAKQAGVVTDVMREKVFRAYIAMRDLGKEYSKVAQEQGVDSTAGKKAEQSYLRAIYAVDKYTQQLGKAVAKQEEFAQKNQPEEQDSGGEEKVSMWGRIGAAISAAKAKVNAFGGAVKKAFQSTLLGRFLKQLGRTMLRMAAMKLIRGTIQAVSEGFEYLSKKSSSCAKAMNTVKGAGNSIKMSLGMALMPIVKALAPVFVWLAGAINSAAQAVANFLAVLTGQGTYTTVGFKDNMDGVTDSIDGAGKSAKRALAAFDELNVIGQKGGGGGGGGTDLTNPFSTVTGDVPAFSELATKIREAIKKGDWKGVGSAVAEKLNEGIDAGLDGNAGATIAQKISSFIRNALDTATGFLETVDWITLGRTIVENIVQFFKNLDYSGVAHSISEFLGSALGAVAGLLVGALAQVVTDLVSGLKTAFTKVKSYDSIGSLIKDGIFGGILRAFDGIQTWLYNNIVVPFVNGFTNAIGLGNVLEPSESLGKSILEGIKKPFKAIGDWINTNIIDPIKDWFSKDHSLGDYIKLGVSLLKNGWDTVSGWVASAINFGKTAVAKGVGLAKSGWTFVSDWVKARFGKTVVAKGVGLLKSGWTFVSDWVKARVGKTMVAKGVGLAKSGWTYVSNWVKDRLGSVSVSKAIGLAKNGWTTVANWIKDPKAFGTAVAKGIGLVKNAWTTVSSWIQDGKLGGAVNKGVGLLKSGWDSVASWINSSWLGGVVSKGVSLTVSFVENAGKKLFEAWNGLKSKTVSLSITASNKFKGAWNSVVSFLNKYFGTHFSKMAKGGIAYGQTTAIIGEYSGAKSNPEVVAPLSTLVGLLEKSNVGSGNSKDSMTREQANTMIRLLQRIEQKENVIYPSVELGQVVDRSKALYART